MTPLLLLLGTGLAADLERGEALYATECSPCHGDTGAGDGPAAPFMWPRPRVLNDFATSKLRTTETGGLPLDADLDRVIRLGLPGTAMPPFPALDDADRADLVAVIRSLSEDYDDPDLAETAVRLPDLDAPAPEPDLAAGAALYERFECAKCHGAAGRGDGQTPGELTDDWGDPIAATDLTMPSAFRGGPTAADVYRAMSTGLNGTPMPTYSETSTTDERWQLSHYVLSLSEDGPPTDAVVAQRVERVPDTAEDGAWASAPVARFETMPNLLEAPRSYWPAVPRVAVQALYDADTLAVRVRWHDRTRSEGADRSTVYADRDGALYTDTPHPDALALQIPTEHDDEARPFFFFGDGRRSVDLWWWATDRSSVTTARGFERMVEAGPLQAEASWSDGRWTLVIRRPRDERIAPGRFVPLAVHVWDGSSGELGRRHAVTSWRWLVLAPEPTAWRWAGPLVAFGGTWLLLWAVAWGARRSATSAQLPDGPPRAPMSALLPSRSRS